MCIRDRHYTMWLFTWIYIYRGSWIAKSFDKQPWIQGTFGKQFTVTAIQTQGRHDYWNWVKTYKMMYSENGIDWHVYKSEDGLDQVIYHLLIIRHYLFNSTICCKYMDILFLLLSGISRKYWSYYCRHKSVAYTNRKHKVYKSISTNVEGAVITPFWDIGLRYERYCTFKYNSYYLLNKLW